MSISLFLKALRRDQKPFLADNGNVQCLRLLHLRRDFVAGDQMSGFIRNDRFRTLRTKCFGCDPVGMQLVLHIGRNQPSKANGLALKDQLLMMFHNGTNVRFLRRRSAWRGGELLLLR